MRRSLFASLFAIAALSASAAGVVDLNDPDVVDGLREHNPRHHDMVMRILAAAREVPHSQVPQAIAVRYEAKDVLFAPLVRVSDPPKMKLSFTLDAVRYTAIVVPNFPPGMLSRADDR